MIHLLEVRGRVFGFSKLAGEKRGLQMTVRPANSENPNTCPRIEARS
jgi:hypothetical protein